MDPTQSASTLRYASDPPPEQSDSLVSSLQLPPPNVDLPIHQRGREAMRIAEAAFAGTASWVTFYREMLGVDGVVRKLFPTSEQMRQFEQSSEFAELQEMVAAMRSQDNSKGDAAEPERMITIRLPKSLHDALRIEADELSLSINKLCISKLLQRIESRFIPIQQGRRRGRRPGPQGPRKSREPATDNGSPSNG
jgi:predicted HicB family RNase H-like nuclease